jgi:hypothetical protein
VQAFFDEGFAAAGVVIADFVQAAIFASFWAAEVWPSDVDYRAELAVLTI